MLVKAETLARAGYTYLGRLYSEMDCQAFVEKCLADCGKKINLAGSNAWYRKMTWTGTPEECKKKFGKIPEGAFLFILEQDGKEPAKYKADGIGNASHIGIYTGRGKGAIHSSASRGCVQESRFAGKTIRGGWNRIGLWDQIVYDGISLPGKENNNNKPQQVKTESEAEKMEMAAKVVLNSTGRGDTVNMRQGPDTQYGIVAKVPVGAEISVIEDGGAWCAIKYKGKKGYMMSDFIEYQTPGSNGELQEMGAAELGQVDRLLSEVERMLRAQQDIIDQIGNIVGRG